MIPLKKKSINDSIVFILEIKFYFVKKLKLTKNKSNLKIILKIKRERENILKHG
jgi:hypothetical protein